MTNETTGGGVIGLWKDELTRNANSSEHANERVAEEPAA